MATTTGGSIIAQILQEEGVEKIFGIIDGTYLRFLKSWVDLGMEVITPRHEAIAAHMAGAYARLTGGLGVCLREQWTGSGKYARRGCGGKRRGESRPSDDRLQEDWDKLP